MAVTTNQGTPVELHHGDLVEASKGEDKIQGRIEVYNGTAYVGHGRSVIFYLEGDWEVRLLESATPVGGIA